MTAAPSQIDISPPLPIAAEADNLGVDDLRELMRAVNETTLRLEQTPVALRTEVARLQRELAEANAQLRRSRSLAALGEMAAGIAHEIRNPLGSIQLYVQMLAEDLADQPDQGDLCKKINRAVSGMDAIVRDVLMFARDMVVRPAPTTAGELINRTLGACEALIAPTGLELQIDAPRDGSCDLHADTGLITQALGNVLRNSIEAMVEAGASPMRLTISAARRLVRSPQGRRVKRIVIAIRDTGPGIPPQVVQRMFNPFFTTRQTGTGLGLAIVHRIVDAHGGHIAVQNIDSGGAIVELCLPLRPKEQRRSSAAGEAPQIEIFASAGAQEKSQQASVKGAL